MRKIFFLLLATCYSLLANSQSQKTYTSSEILLQLKKLNVLGSVLYVGAHPDDENNPLLPWLANEKLYRTAYLSLTRGDGGQNLIGDEQGVELGLIRTQELLAARKVDGAEQYFTRAYEFGFSKSSEEALRIWDREKILSDVVWVIRQYQPDVIIKRFPPDARAGHGHHAASAILADEAFTAAADPKRFPEQFKYGVKPWQAKRIMWNTFNFGSTNTTSEDQLKIDIGGYNSLLGKSYGEMGGDARTMHKSQGEGRPRNRGQSIQYFVTTAGDNAKTDLMDGVVTDWKRINGGDGIQSMINNIIGNYKTDQPELSVPALVKLYQSIKALPQSNWTNKKLNEVQQIIEECSA
ncbi:MAG TPA: PIG-L family deacetylase, partial [Chitinophagaceae bacterium]